MPIDIDSLRNRRVLLLEDDYYLATDLQEALEAAGATVVGPFADPGEAERALDGATLDCAFIDLNLGDGPSFDLPRALLQRQIPFAFVTGYDRGAIPDEFADVVRFEKPIAPGKVVQTVALILQGK